MTHIALIVTDLSGSALAHNGCSHRFAYTAFGGLPARFAGASAYRSLWLENGYYLPGNGVRVYAPQFLRFYTPDSWSPFGKGGLNAYAYCGAEPVNHSDPTGHAPFKFWQRLVGLLRSKRTQALTASSSQESIALASGITNPDFVGGLPPSHPAKPAANLPPPRPPKPAAPIPPTPIRTSIERLDNANAVAAPPRPPKPIKPVGKKERAPSPERIRIPMRTNLDGDVEWEFKPGVWTRLKR